MSLDFSETLFKYQSFHKYTKNMLMNGEAYFCPISELDDYFESAISLSKKILDGDADGYVNEILPFIISIVSAKAGNPSKEIDYLSFYKNGKLSQNKLRKYIVEQDNYVNRNSLEKFLKFLKDMENSGKLKKFRKGLRKFFNIKNDYGVYSLTTKATNQPMWIFYANNYEGIVFEYDMQKYRENNKNSEIFVYKVNYSDDRKKDPFQLLLSIFYDALFKKLGLGSINIKYEKDIEDIMLTKSTDWERQDERRIINKAKGKWYLPVKAVYMGANIKPKNREMVLKCAKGKYRVYEQIFDKETCDISFSEVEIPQ